MTRMSISVSGDGALVRRRYKFPCSPIIILAIIPLIAIGGLVWWIVRTYQILDEKEPSKEVALEDTEIETMGPFEVNVRYHDLKFFHRENESNWEQTFSFVQLFSPTADVLGFYGLQARTDTSKQVHVIWQPIQHVNRLNPKPRFAVITAPYRRTEWNDTFYRDVVDGFLLLVRELDPEIGLVLISDALEVGDKLTRSAVEQYKDQFGDDHFDFLVGGTKVIITNSNYDYFKSSEVMSLATEHNYWFAMTLQEAKNNDSKYKHTIVIRHSLIGVTTTNDGQFVEAIPAFLLEQMSSSGVDYLLTYQGQNEDIEISNETTPAASSSNSSKAIVELTTDSEQQQQITKSGHKHMIEPADGGDDGKRNHEDHLDKSHSHSHAYHEPNTHEHDMQAKLSTNFLKLEVIFANNLDEDQYRVVWVFDERIEEQVYETKDDHEQ